MSKSLKQRALESVTVAAVCILMLLLLTGCDMEEMPSSNTSSPADVISTNVDESPTFEKTNDERIVAEKELVAVSDGLIVVYIGKDSERYHNFNCYTLRKTKDPITLEEAKARLLPACSKCDPPL